MKELNELELRDVEGGIPFKMIVDLGPIMWTQITLIEFAAGIAQGWNDNKR